MLFLSAFVSAQSARTNQDAQGQIVNRRIVDLPVLKPNVKPKLTLQRALKLAEDYIEKEKSDISSYYLLEARLIHYGSEKSLKEPRWFFLWAHESGAIGNQVEITVSMEGKAVRHPSM
jgi:hypothetical protein